MTSPPNYEKEVAVWVAIGMVLCGGSLLLSNCTRSEPAPIAKQQDGVYGRPPPPESENCPPRKVFMAWNTQPQGGKYEKSNSTPAKVAGRFPAT